jgi:glycosyltransferase involved in cell wall biosynthesis
VDAGVRSLCINSQTPLVRFLLPPSDLAERYPELPDPAPLDTFQEGTDYVPTAGGVVQVVLPLVRYMLDHDTVDRIFWLSLSPLGPRRIVWNRITLLGVSLGPPELRAYTRAKEKVWNLIHGLPTPPMDDVDFAAFARYNWESANSMYQLAREVDLFYVHDFQQMMTGTMIGLTGPCVLRWHIPMTLERTPPAVARFIVRSLEGFDSVIVSCRRDLEGLIAAGFRGRARQIYPQIDPRPFQPASEEAQNALRQRLGIEDGAPVVLNVGRMDPMKSQDVLLRAVRRLIDKYPRLKLVLVGNGSFTGSGAGGLGSSKAHTWRRRLEHVVREEGLGSHVVFAGHVSHPELCAAYSLAHVFVLPSLSEGFGLVVPEAWLFRKPVVVSTGAGASELVVDGSNGLRFAPGDAATLAQHLDELLLDESKRRELGRKGWDTAHVVFAENRVPDVLGVLREAREAYR